MVVIKNIGSMDLERGWPYGSHTWKPGMDRNLQKLAYITHLAVLSRTTDPIPDTGSVGDVYIDPTTDEIVFWDKDEDDVEKWLGVTPSEGMLAYVADTGTIDGYVGDPLSWQSVFDPTSAVPTPEPRSVPVFIPGEVIPNFTVYMQAIRISVDFAPNFSGSFGYADADPTADVVFSVQKNDVEFGTVTFPLGSQTATFAGTAESFVEGDILKVVSPGATHGLSNVAFTLKGLTPGI